MPSPKSKTEGWYEVVPGGISHFYRTSRTVCSERLLLPTGDEMFLSDDERPDPTECKECRLLRDRERANPNFRDNPVSLDRVFRFSIAEQSALAIIVGKALGAAQGRRPPGTATFEAQVLADLRPHLETIYKKVMDS